MTKTLILLLAGSLSLSVSCMQNQHTPIAKALNTESQQTVNPFLTHDEKGKAVLCWTELNPADSLYRLTFARYDHERHLFEDPLTVPVSAGTTPVAESMNKVAFKSDGTIIAVFGKPFPDQQNPYAAAIYYSMSSDGGKSWTEAAYLHSDTSRNVSRNFFDVATLADGEVGAVWLDGRFGKATEGSALFFNRTEKGEGFGTDKCIDRQTCECCRTELLTDTKGNIHVAFRSIQFPKALMGKQVRDMVYTSSEDDGQSFTPVKPISNDNWIIDGCPHTGPSLAVTSAGVHAVWFTAGGNPGLYHTALAGGQSRFTGRRQVSKTGRHPQLLALPDNTLVTVWEEPSAAVKTPEHQSPTHSINSMHHGPAAADATRIVVSLLKDGHSEKKVFTTTGLHAEHHAVLSAVDQGVLLAWVQENHQGSAIHYAFIGLKD